MKHQFAAIVSALCEAEHLPQPQRFIDGEPLELHGTEFSFLYDDDIDADAMMLRVVFGHAPLENETEIYQQLLQQNHVGFSGNGPGFCVSPASGKVLYLLKMPLAQTTPALLAGTMLYFTEKVKQWQTDYFLPPSVARRRRSTLMQR